MRRALLPILLFLCAICAICASGQERLPPSQAATPRPVVAVVLSGGAALGFAHVGVLKVIEEMGIPVDIVVGASMGAIVGGLYAAGYSPADMERIAAGVDWRSGFNEAMADSPYSFREREVSRRFPLTVGFDTGGFWAGRGLLSGQSITTLLEELTLNVSATEDFDQLPRRYRAVAADVATGEEVVLGRGRLADAMRASATIPLLFKPFILQGRPLVDGGVVNRLPTDVARDLGADIVIAVDVHENPARSPEELRTMADMLGQVSTLLVEQNIGARLQMADLVITPDLSGFRRLDFPREAAIIQRGEAEARRYAPQLHALAALIAETRSLEPAAARPGTYLSRAAPVAQSLQVEGLNGDAEQIASRVFSPLLGRPIDPQRLDDAVNEAYQTGRFDDIRVGLSRGPLDEPRLVVEATPVAPPRAAALLGIQYEGDVSSTLANTLVISPGVIVRDLTGKGSQLLVDALLVDALGAGVEYFQPLGRRLFLDGFLGYVYDRDIFLQGDSAQIGRLARGPQGGAWAGVLLGQSGEVKAGVAWSSQHYIDPATPVARDTTTAVARAQVSYDTRPAAVFPMGGIGVGLSYEQAIPALGGTESFKKLSLDASAAIPLTSAFTVGLSVSGGTDFTFGPTAPGVLGPADAFSLRTESQFRGYQEWDVRGSHKLAGGLDLQYRLPWLNELTGSDFYVLANLSAGSCWADPWQVSPASLHYGASAGLGARIRRNFELATRVCWVDSGRIGLAVDIGSFAMDDSRAFLR
jgi:NTE family protein